MISTKCFHCKRSNTEVFVTSNGYCSACNHERYINKKNGIRGLTSNAVPFIRKRRDKYCACEDIIYIRGMCKHCYLSMFKKYTNAT